MATMSNKLKQKPKLEPTLFNSKLYIDVDFKEENLSTYSNSEESEQINKSPSQKKLNQYLSIIFLFFCTVSFFSLQITPFLFFFSNFFKHLLFLFFF